jgi:ferritin-like metal-binding protein YciE
MYSAENQLVKALPKLAKGAKSPKLKQLFTAHLQETKGQVERLKKVFAALGEKPTGQHCNGMEGVIEEGKDALEKDEEGASFDSGSSEPLCARNIMRLQATRPVSPWQRH